MTTTQAYRDIEYKIEQSDSDRWQWTCYPRTGIDTKMSGTVTGSHRAAEAACQRAIAEFLDGKPNEGTP